MAAPEVHQIGVAAKAHGKPQELVGAHAGMSRPPSCLVFKKLSWTMATRSVSW